MKTTKHCCDKKLREGIYRYPAQDTWKLIFIWQDLLQQALQKKFRATLEVKKDFWEKYIVIHFDIL